MVSNRFLPQSENLSIAWAELFLNLMDQGPKELSPVVVTVNEMDGHRAAREHVEIRDRLDRELQARGLQSCHTVANTIFPEALWFPTEENSAERLYARHERIWSRVARCPQNRRGVYFRRLTAFQPKGTTSEPVNQLKHLIETYQNGNHRRSALQAAVFDPTRDHTNSRRQGFPCLQQVGFFPIEGAGLCVTGFYPTQYVFTRAYGNYLGLCRLGRFVATQLGLQLVRMVCIASVAVLDQPKGALQAMADDVGRLVARNEKRS